MKVVIQRVNSASLYVNNAFISSVGKGVVCYLGIGKGDSIKDVEWLSKKTAGLRIFKDSCGKMNLSLLDCGYEVLVVSQFTLFGSVKKGYRPSFVEAEEPKAANQMYEAFCEELKKSGIKKVAHGIFGADMQIKQENSGPVTIIIDSKNK